MTSGEPDVASRDLGTLGEIAKRLGARVVGDPNVRVAGIASIEEAHDGDLTFATNARYLRAALRSKAGAVLTEEAALQEVAQHGRKPLLVVQSARAALPALLASYEPRRVPGTQIHPTAAIDPTATLGPDAIVGPFAVIGARARVGARATIGAGSVIGADARLGDDAVLHPRAMLLDRCVAGDRLVLQAGAVVGSDGFGYVPGDGRAVAAPSIRF